MGLERGKYIVVTLHRPSNVDRRETLTPLVEQLLAAAARLPVVFAVHPRTRKKLEEFALLEHLRASRSIHLTEPLGYVQFMALVSGAAAAVTDSGGVQEESTYLGIPCLTLRENTERPITVTQGSNRLVQPLELLENVERVLAGKWPTGSRPDGWDGHAAQRCVASLWEREQRRRNSG
jgi:UDP-N-acetylglucosamine 2-epimerase (non-hydrolysing)